MCSGLKSITIPNSVTTIGEWAFHRCTGLTSITIPNSVTSIEEYAFSHCSGLTSVTIGNSVTTIGEYSFQYCTGLKGITIPNSVASIGERAFLYCDGLTSVTIPNSVTSFGYGAFMRCSNILSINIDNNYLVGNKEMASIFGSQIQNCIIGDNVTSIGNSTFSGCYNLKNINITRHVTSIGTSAFSGCYSLKNVTIPESVTSIGSNAFYNCSSDIILLPKSVYVGEKCFENSSGHSYVYTFANNVLELSKTDHDKYFKNCSVYPGPDIMDRSISQSTISISPSTRLTAKTVKMDGRIFNAEGGSIQYTQLTPNKTYTLTVIGRVRDCDSDYTFDVDLTTRDLSLWLKQTDATNLTLSVEGDNDGDAQIVGYSFLANEVQNSGELARGEWKATGLKPNQRVQVSMTARTVDGYTKTITRSFETRDLDVTFDAQTTGTSATITGSASMIDATYISSCFKESGKDRVTIYGLDPYSSYSWCYYVTTKEGGEVPYYTTFYTQDLYMATQAAQPMTTKKARLIANTNCDDDAMRCGFEWIRYDAPEEMKPTSVSCPVYNGVIMGTLNGVNPDTYYKYRPYYQSNSGQRYYGDWVAFITADASVYFEPEIHTMDASDITSTSAKVRGYAVAGSDDISEQGFEYWTETSGTQRKASSGTLMQTTLSGLTPSTKYFYRSFTTAGAKTTYGEEREFTTNPDATSIELIPTDTPERTVVGYYNLQGQRINEPQRGVNIIRYSDGTAKKVLLK